MPVAIAAALGFASVGAMATAAVVGAAKMLATSVILGGASHLLAKKPKTPSGASLSASPTQVSARSPASPHQIVYGQTRVGGTVVFMGNGSADGKDYWLNIAIVLACHRCDGLVTIYFDDYPLNVVWNGVNTGYEAGKYYGGAPGASHVFVEWMSGDPNQGASQILTTHEGARGYGANHRMRGRCAIVLRLLNHVLPNGKSVWDTGFPPNITAVIRGKADIYDPRGNSTGYTTNAALIQADYLASGYGLGAAYGGDIDTALLAAAANVCDEQVALAAVGTEARYSINGVVSSSTTPREALQALLTASAGKLIWSGGKWQLYAGAWETPTLTLSESDLAGPIRVQSRLSRREACNRVKGLYVSPADRYAVRDFPPVSDAAYLAEDQGEVITREVEYPYTLSVAAAQRLAKIELQRARRQMRVTAPCKLSAYRARPGQTVYLQNTRMGWTGAGKAFVVEGDAVLRVEADGSYSYDLPLVETDANVYAWNLEETAPPPAPATALANPFVPPTPGAPTLADSDVYLLTRLNTVYGPLVARRKALITLPARPSGFFVTTTEIRYKHDLENEWHLMTVPAETASVVTDRYLIENVACSAQVRWRYGDRAGPWGPLGFYVVGQPVTDIAVGPDSIDTAQLKADAASLLTRVAFNSWPTEGTSFTVNVPYAPSIDFAKVIATWSAFPHNIAGVRRFIVNANLDVTWSSLSGHTSELALALRFRIGQGAALGFIQPWRIGNVDSGQSVFALDNTYRIQAYRNARSIWFTGIEATGLASARMELLAFAYPSGTNVTISYLALSGELAIYDTKR